MLHFSTFLSSTFTHLNTGRTDCKKSKIKNSAEVTHQAVLQYYFPSFVQFISSSCFYGFPKLLCKQTLRQPILILAILTRYSNTWPTDLFAKQLVKALLAHTVFESYRRNTPEA